MSVAREVGGGGGGNGAQRRRARPEEEALLDAWVAELEAAAPVEKRPRTPAAAAPVAPAAPVEKRARTPWPVQIDGPLATFTDAIGGAIVVGRVGPYCTARGTVAMRGPLAPDDADLQALGFDEAQRRAVDFALAWFGAPFDAVNARLRDDAPLSWGAWHFAGARLADALATFAADAPEAAAARLGVFGIGVDDGALTLTAPRAPVERGEAAEDAIAASPALCAALARAGHDPAAMRAQLQVLSRAVLQPLLALPVGERTVGAVLRSPRALAVVLYADLAWGAGAGARLQELAAAGDEAAALDRLTTELRRTRARELGAFLRILTSPEVGPR
jgi:hypothetical protein